MFPLIIDFILLPSLLILTSRKEVSIVKPKEKHKQIILDK